MTKIQNISMGRYINRDYNGSGCFVIRIFDHWIDKSLYPNAPYDGKDMIHKFSNQ